MIWGIFEKETVYDQKGNDGVAGIAMFVFGAQPAAAKTLDAVASFTVLADVVAQVGGEHVNVVIS